MGVISDGERRSGDEVPKRRRDEVEDESICQRRCLVETRRRFAQAGSLCHRLLMMLHTLASGLKGIASPRVASV